MGLEKEYSYYKEITLRKGVIAMLMSFLRRAGIGFLLGIVMGDAITVICGYAQTGTALFFAPEFLQRAGNELNAVVIQSLLAGLYGAVNMGMTILYDLEKPPLTLVTAAHCLIVMLPYIPLSLYLCWIETAAEMITVMSVMLAAYFMIWLIMYIIYKIQVKELNNLQTEYLAADREMGVLIR